MAGVSGSELAKIHQQIQEFPENHSDFMESGEPAFGAKTGSRRADREKQTEAEIERLETNIKELEKKIYQQKEQHRLLKAWQQYQCHASPNETSPDVVHAQIEALKYQIDQLGEVSEVKLVETKSEVTARGKLWCKKRKHVEGFCGSLDFTLDMSVEEKMSEDESVTARITDLSISASDSILQDLGSTVEKLATECNGQGFLRLLQPYNTWLSARETTFQHFVSKYPLIANRASPHELCLNHPCKNVTFVIQWTFKVTDIYSVVPDIQLNIRVPKNVSTQNSVIQTAGEKFQLMLKELGVEKAIHSLIKLLQV